ncbi:MAG: GC-type dockerin domain-anchored protein, partial [Planctomycetota bacterium]
GGPGSAGPVFIRDGFAPAAQPSRFDGDLSFGPLASSKVEVSETTVAIDVAGNLGAAGELVIDLAPGFTPAAGDVYEVLRFASVGGAFQTVTLDPVLIEAGVDTSRLLIDGTITIPGDGGCNAADIAEPFGVLNASDINAFVTGFLAGDATIASLAPPAGVVNASDINAFVTGFVGGCP